MRVPRWRRRLRGCYQRTRSTSDLLLLLPLALGFPVLVEVRFPTLQLIFLGRVQVEIGGVCFLAELCLVGLVSEAGSHFLRWFWLRRRIGNARRALLAATALGRTRASPRCRWLLWRQMLLNCLGKN